MRGFCIIVFLVCGITLCFGAERQAGTAALCHHNKGGFHHYYKYLHLHHLYYLAFFVLKVKVILVVGSIWAAFILVGKIIGAFKLAEYMKSKPQIVYGGYHHGHDRNFNFAPYDSSPPHDVSDHLSNRIYSEPIFNYNKYKSSYKTLPTNIGRGFLSSNSTPLENLKIFFDTIKRLNLTEIVFKEMKLKTAACKKKFVCEADYNVKQSVIVKSIFNLFIDDCYKKYRSKEAISKIEDCTKVNPACADKDIHPQDDI